MSRARDLADSADKDVAGTLTTDGLTVAGNVSVDGGTIKLDGNYPTGTANVALGDTALDSLTSGGYNVAIGNGTLSSNTSANGNNAVGHIAMAFNTTGATNNAFGNEALTANTTGSNNSALGHQALAANTTGAANTAVGYTAFAANTTASGGVAIGNRAMDANTTGDYNVGIGHDALGANTTGTLNTAVGATALDACTEANNGAAFGYAALGGVTTGSHNSAFGVDAGKRITTGTVNSCFGKGAGEYITTGSKNTVIGRYNGNQGGLDIRTQSNHIVLSDGDGNPRTIVDNGGNHMFNKTAVGDATAGVDIRTDGRTTICRNGSQPLNVSRTGSDGTLIAFLAQGTEEGQITVSGSTVSYNGGHLSRWSQLTDGTKDTSIIKGTVMTNLDQMAEWSYDEGVYTIDDVLPDGVSVGDVRPAYTEDNEQLNCMAVSSVEGDANVAGVFVNWDNDDDNFNDMNVAMTGDMVIRIASGTTVARGDLLMSAGDGTAKPQGDDIVRSKTIAKVTSTTVSHTYDDGSYCVPCVLMAC